MRNRSSLALARGLALAAAALLQNSCGETAGDQEIEAVSARGKAILRDGTPVEGEMTYRVLVNGRGLFEEGANGCSHVDDYMPAVVTGTISPDGDGRYELDTELDAAVAPSDPDCRVSSITRDKIDGLRLEASIRADAGSCASHCKGSEAGASCLEECESGSRLLSSSDTLSRGELEKIMDDRGAARLELSQDLRFESLGLPLSPGVGPDLVVNREAIDRSVRVTRDRFDADACAIVEACIGGPGERKLLRFDGDIVNLGSEALELGSPEGNPGFEFSACHGHYHLRNMMLYELLTLDRQAVVADGAAVAGNKQGFCMMDTYASNDAGPSAGYSCEFQGLSPGWADSYDGALDCQWVDVTEVPAGRYVLRVTVNPEGTFEESDTGNNVVETVVRIP